MLSEKKHIREDTESQADGEPDVEAKEGAADASYVAAIGAWLEGRRDPADQATDVQPESVAHAKAYPACERDRWDEPVH